MRSIRKQRSRIDKNMFNTALSIIRKNLKGYMLMNVLYYGLVVAFMGYALAFPAYQSALTGTFTAATAIQPGFPLAPIVDAYRSGNFPLAAALTFGFNLVLGSLSFITAPSMVVPFGGIIAGAIRAALWGLLFAPTSPEQALILVPHALTIILEGQAYVLAMFASYVQWRGIFQSGESGSETKRKAYFQGARNTLSLYGLIAVVLAISAAYEAFEVIYVLAPLMS